MALHCGSLTKVRSNWASSSISCASAAHSRTHATSWQLFGLGCASHVLTSVLLLFVVQVFSVVHPCLKYQWGLRKFVAPRRYLTTLVSFEAVGNCLITLLVGFSRTFVAPGPNPPARETASQTGTSGCPWPLDLWRIDLSTESTDQAFQREGCEVNHARGDAPVRNLW